MNFLYSLLAILNEMSPYIILGFLIAGLLHVFVKPSLMTRHLSGNGMGSVIKAALLGIPLPLCSCGVLPTAVSLRRNGASKAASTSFLIATPQTGVDSIAATYSLLGPAMAVTRPVAALVCSLLGGGAVGRFTPDKCEKIDIQDECHNDCCCDHGTEHQHISFWQKLLESVKYGFVDMIQHVGKWLVIGLVIAAVITVFVPNDLFVGLARYPIIAMLAMLVVAIPMYICATGSIPIALSLMLKGLTPGVAFVMLMAGPAANFASVMVLKRSMGTKATAIYLVSVVITALVFGLLIDYMLPAWWFSPKESLSAACCNAHSFGVFDTICSVSLVAMLIYALVIKKLKHEPKINTLTDMTQTFKVSGMKCQHCQANVQNVLKSLHGVEEVEVDLGKGIVIVKGKVNADDVITKIQSLGYEAEML